MLSTTPLPSCPSTTGKKRSPLFPLAIVLSEWQTPVLIILIRTSPTHLNLNCFYDSGLGSLPCYCASAGYRLGIVEKDIIIEPFMYALMLIFSDVILWYGRYVIT